MEDEAPDQESVEAALARMTPEDRAITESALASRDRTQRMVEDTQAVWYVDYLRGTLDAARALLRLRQAPRDGVGS